MESLSTDWKANCPSVFHPLFGFAAGPPASSPVATFPARSVRGHHHGTMNGRVTLHYITKRVPIAVSNPHVLLVRTKAHDRGY